MLAIVLATSDLHLQTSIYIQVCKAVIALVAGGSECHHNCEFCFSEMKMLRDQFECDCIEHLYELVKC